MNKRFFSTLAILTSFLAIISATDIYLPSLPHMATYFNAPDDTIRMSIPLYLLGSFLSSPIWGILSDHHSRHHVLWIGVGIFLAGSLACTITPTLSLLLLARFVQGVGAIAVPIVGWVIIQDIYPADKSVKIISQMGTIMTVCPLGAPLVGGIIDVMLGWRANFALVTLGAFIAALSLAVVKSDPSPLRSKSPASLKTTLQNYWRILTHQTFLSYVLVYAFLIGGEYCYLTLAPFYFGHTLGFSPDIFSFYIAAMGGTYVLGTTLTPKLIGLIGLENTILTGISFALCGTLLLLIGYFLGVDTPLWIAVTIACYFGGAAFIWSPSTSRALQCFEHIRGSSSAVRSLLISSAAVLGGFAGSILGYTDILPLGLFLFVTAGLSLWMFLRICYRSRFSLASATSHEG